MACGDGPGAAASWASLAVSHRRRLCRWREIAILARGKQRWNAVRRRTAATVRRHTVTEGHDGVETQGRPSQRRAPCAGAISPALFKEKKGRRGLTRLAAVGETGPWSHPSRRPPPVMQSCPAAATTSGSEAATPRACLRSLPVEKTMHTAVSLHAPCRQEGALLPVRSLLLVGIALAGEQC